MHAGCRATPLYCSRCMTPRRSATNAACNSIETLRHALLLADHEAALSRKAHLIDAVQVLSVRRAGKHHQAAGHQEHRRRRVSSYACAPRTGCAGTAERAGACGPPPHEPVPGKVKKEVPTSKA
jgi:hypothetical protein